MEKSSRYQPGRSFLELQLAFMNQALSLAGQGAQQMLRSLESPGHKRQRRTASEAPAAQVATREQLARAQADYVTRMQEDVDQILHAFAMVPVAAERAILQSVQREPARREKSPEAQPKVQSKPRRAKPRGEHAA